MRTAPTTVGHPESVVLAPTRPIPGISDTARLEAERRTVGRRPTPEPVPPAANEEVCRAA
jgi:hypothetical protein